MISITAYLCLFVYCTILVYEWHGTNPLVSRAFWICTLPNLFSQWVQGLCFIITPSL